MRVALPRRRFRRTRLAARDRRIEPAKEDVGTQRTCRYLYGYLLEHSTKLACRSGERQLLYGRCASRRRSGRGSRSGNTLLSCSPMTNRSGELRSGGREKGHFWRWRESWRWARARLLGLGGNCITTITGVLRRLRRLRSSWAASFRSWPLLASDSDSRTRALAGRRSGLRLRLLLLRLLFLEAGCRTPFASRRLRL
jgi:hypothetical protein